MPPLWLLSTAFTRFGSFNDMLTSCIFPFGLPKSNSFLFSVYRNDATSGVAKVLRDLKEVLGEPESNSTNLADKLNHVGRRAKNYSPRGWVGGGGKGKENLSVPPRTITPRVKGTYKHNSSHSSLAVSGTFANKETIDYFRIIHNALCLSPKFGLSYCFHML